MGARFFCRRGILLAASLISFVLLGPDLVFAATSATTAPSQVISAGSLSLTAPSTTSLTSITVSNSSQTTTGTLSGVNVYDQRGSAAGWTSSLTMEHLTVTKNPIAVAPNSSPLPTLTSGARYDGTCGETSPATIYTVTIGTGGAVGTATYSVTGGCTGESNQTNVTTASTNNSIGSRGVKIDFPSGTYVANDSWKIPVDMYAFTKMTVTPQAATAALSGSDLTGLTAGSSGALSGSGSTSNSKTILTASSGNGMGSYNQDVSLELTVHSNQYAGTYSGTITVTVS